MKNIIAIIAVILFAGSTTLIIAEDEAKTGDNTKAKQQTTQQINRGANFVDQNGDGVCDRMGKGPGPNFVDADGDGVCDNQEKMGKNGKGCCGKNFVDEDGDGKCDNQGKMRKGKGCCGKGKGMGRGNK